MTPEDLVGATVLAVRYDKRSGDARYITLLLSNGKKANLVPGYCRQFDDCLIVEELV